MKTKLLMAILFIATTSAFAQYNLLRIPPVTKPGIIDVSEWTRPYSEMSEGPYIFPIVINHVNPEDVILTWPAHPNAVWGLPSSTTNDDFIPLRDPGIHGIGEGEEIFFAEVKYICWPELWINDEYWCEIRTCCNLNSSGDTLIHIPNAFDKVELRVHPFFSGVPASCFLTYNSKEEDHFPPRQTVYTLTETGQYRLITLDAAGSAASGFTLKFPKHTISANAYNVDLIEPNGNIEIAEGDDMTFTWQQHPQDLDLYIKFYQLLVDGEPVEVTGNTYTFNNVQQNHTIYADYRHIYSFMATAGEHGRIEPQGYQYNIWPSYTDIAFPENRTFTFIPDAGYEVDKVTIDGEEVQPVDNTYTCPVLNEFYILKNVHVTFREIASEYTIAATVSGAGVPANPEEYLTPYGNIQVTEGDSQTFTFVRNPDSQTDVSRIWVNDTPEEVTGDTYTFNDIQQDCTFHVDYDYYYPYMATSGEHGTIDPQGYLRSWYSDSHSEGRTFTFTPDEGYEVDKVTVDGIEIQPNGNTCYVSHTGAENWGVVKDIRVTFRETTSSIFDAEAEQIHIYPVPVINTLYIKVENGALVNAKLHNLQGQLVWQTNEPEIDFSAYPAGTYLLNVNGAWVKVVK